MAATSFDPQGAAPVPSFAAAAARRDDRMAASRIAAPAGSRYSQAMSSCVKRMEKECLARQAAMTARAVGRVYAATLRPLGLQPTQVHLLGALSLYPDAGMAELSAMLVIDRSTLVRNLKLLERDGLIAASRPPGSRAKRFAVTEAGRRLVASVEPLWEEAHRRLVAALGPGGLDAACAALERLRAAALEAAPGDE